jgi:hypothetical protein
MRTSRLLRACLLSCLSVAVVLGLGGGCGKTGHSAGRLPPEDDAGGGTAGSQGHMDASIDHTGTAPACIEGTREDCSVDLPSGLGCFHGKHQCVDGTWTDCMNEQDLPPLPGQGGAGGAAGAAGAGAPSAGASGSP